MLTLPAIPRKVLSNRVLSGGQAEVRQTAAGLQVSIAESDRQPIDTIIGLELDGAAFDLSAVDVPGPVSLTAHAHAKTTASNVYQNLAEYGSDKAVDGRTDTRWATDSGTTSAWLELDLGQPVTFSRVRIKQAFPELKRVRKFAIEYWRDEQWKPCYLGENLPATLAAKFESVTAQRVRLNITEATDGPTLWEFQLAE